MNELTHQDKQKASVLKNEYLRRKKNNANYSQRAFARDLGVSHTLISLVASGKRALSIELSRKLLADLELPKEEQDLLAMGLPVDIKGSHDEISVERFSVIADWVIYAILSLTDTDDFIWCEKWISSRLGTSERSAKLAMIKLKKYDLIDLTPGQRPRQKGAPFVVDSKKTSKACQKFNKNLLKKAIVSMENLPLDQRDLSSMVFAMDPKYIAYAIDRIKNFRVSLSKELENLGESKEVYALTVQLCPLTKIKGKS